MRNPTKLIVSTLGTIAGLAGVEHGVGEVLQGNVATGGMAIVAWPDSDLFSVLSGEPAMTIVPNMLVTGVLAITISLTYVLCATVFAGKKHSSLALVLLSIAMLLFGAGFGSAIVGLIVGLIATRVGAPLSWWRTHLPSGARHFLGKLWPASYAACVVAWLLLLPGTVILAQVFGVDAVSLVVPIIMLLAFGSVPVAVVTGFARDIGPEGNDGRRPNRPVGTA